MKVQWQKGRGEGFEMFNGFEEFEMFVEFEEFEMFKGV